ncbi:type II toxin-antitoxin system RelE/ParE family toxin [Desulfonatronovibrio hydrogenovorans]|uniref:type II toxin-antitoxin system RelE/ParE family toxin n=1 Tax=Desulfonatronovibrio hydrogenovorans TaxID=53245 RepID=UPI00048A8545|nr:type II toxin-antitoxin system RelE/ParE family toxin [Desulfonatronovibrio hydrogenovorans]
MSQAYQIKWAAVAQSDLKQIIDHIAADSPESGLRILKSIREKASRLYTLPDQGRIVPELKDQGIHIYREIIVPPWRIIYRISEITVFVLSVIDSRRNVEDILLDRFVK